VTNTTVSVDGFTRRAIKVIASLDNSTMGDTITKSIKLHPRYDDIPKVLKEALDNEN